MRPGPIRTCAWAKVIMVMRVIRVIKMLVIYLAHQIVFGKSILIPDLECKYTEHKHISSQLKRRYVSTQKKIQKHITHLKEYIRALRVRLENQF